MDEDMSKLFTFLENFDTENDVKISEKLETCYLRVR